MNEFQNFKQLFTSAEFKITKVNEGELCRAALEWKEANATFGHKWRGGLLIFKVPGLGDYFYAFIIKMMHFEHWGLQPWKEGFKHGRYVMKLNDEKRDPSDEQYRDANPYQKSNFYAREAWDAGYIQGLSNYRFHKRKKQIELLTNNP